MVTCFFSLLQKTSYPPRKWDPVISLWHPFPLQYFRYRPQRCNSIDICTQVSPAFFYAIDAINFYRSGHLEEVNANEELDKKQHEDFTNFALLSTYIFEAPTSARKWLHYFFFLICSFFCRANTFKKYNLQNIGSLKKWYNQEVIESISCSRL